MGFLYALKCFFQQSGFWKSGWGQTLLLGKMFSLRGIPEMWGWLSGGSQRRMKETKLICRGQNSSAGDSSCHGEDELGLLPAPITPAPRKGFDPNEHKQAELPSQVSWELFRQGTNSVCVCVWMLLEFLPWLGCAGKFSSAEIPESLWSCRKITGGVSAPPWTSGKVCHKSHLC